MPKVSLSSQAADSLADTSVSGRSDSEPLRAAARSVARAEVADAVVDALEADGRSLRQLQQDTGLDPAFLSKLANGRNKGGANVASLALIALAMGKTLRISIE